MRPILDLNRFKKTRLLVETVFSFDYDLILFGGGIKGGKTYSALAAAVLLCNQYAGCVGAVLRKDAPVLERNTLPKVEEILPVAFGGEIKQRKGYFELLFANKSKLIFIGENFNSDKELNRFRGFDINFAILEEINELQEPTFDRVIERIGTNRHTCNIPPFILATCNPSWGWIKPRLYDVMQSENCPEKWIFIKSLAADNPLYTPDQFKFWRDTLTPTAYSVMILGNWEIETKKGALLKEFSPNRHLRPINFDPSKPIHVSFDNNVQPYIACTIFQIDGEKKIIRQIHEMPFKSPYNQAKIAGQQLGVWLQSIGYNDVVFLYGDASGNNRTTADNLTFFGRIQKELSAYYTVSNRVKKSNPRVAVSFAFLNSILSGSENWKVEINENCETSISDYANTMEDENGGVLKKHITDSSGNRYEQYGHLTDTFKYFICTVLASEFLRFKKNIK